MNKFIIIGGGLTGLSCAFKLVHMEILPENIEIFEARQEIGSPTRSPGIASFSNNIDFLLNNIKLQKLTLLNNENNFLTFRREWLEKSLLIHLTDLGCKINLKETINENKLKNIISFIKEKSIIINCAGKKKSSSGFPGDFTNFINSKIQLISIKPKKLVNWYGYLSIEKNKTIIKKTFISINKKDGLNEIWTCDLDKITKEKYKFIEIIKSSFPPTLDDILANNTIDRGFLLANKAIQ